jgi:hypothetical protein
MAPQNRFRPKKQKKRSKSTPYTPAAAPSKLPEPIRSVVFGKAFIVMEDREKNTFVFNGSGWVPHSMSMAECRATCQVKELPQKLNDKTRYEVREPVE